MPALNEYQKALKQEVCKKAIRLIKAGYNVEIACKCSRIAPATLQKHLKAQGLTYKDIKRRLK